MVRLLEVHEVILMGQSFGVVEVHAMVLHMKSMYDGDGDMDELVLWCMDHPAVVVVMAGPVRGVLGHCGILTARAVPGLVQQFSRACEPHRDWE